MGMGIKEKMARRAAREIAPGCMVNLGIGMPTMVADYIPENSNILLQGENGILGIGPSPLAGQEDPLVTNAGGLPCSIVPDGSYFDSTVSFAMIRKGMIDLTILGTLQVSQQGDLANWIIPGKLVPGMGGGMELALRSKKVMVLTSHVSKKGGFKLLKDCSFPLTAPGCVDLIITDLAVIHVTEEGLLLSEIFAHTSIEEVQRRTEAPLRLADPVTIIQ